MQRMGMVIGIKPDQIKNYKLLHAVVWPDILHIISACNITNYSIFLKEPENLLFGYWEYTGDEFKTDVAKMAANPRIQEWWDVCTPCQQPLATRADGEWWAAMAEVFHHE